MHVSFLVQCTRTIALHSGEIMHLTYMKDVIIESIKKSIYECHICTVEQTAPVDQRSESSSTVLRTVHLYFVGNFRTSTAYY